MKVFHKDYKRRVSDYKFYTALELTILVSLAAIGFSVLVVYGVEILHM